jgi:hypothetical protein
VWLSVENLPGYAAEYGDPDSIVGASDSGVYLWSAAAADRADADEPYIVVEREVRYLRDLPALADAAVAGINSSGTVLARDAAGDDLGRAFLLELGGSSERIYLDEFELDAPADFDLAATELLAISDGGALVLDSESGHPNVRQVWVLLDERVTALWVGFRSEAAFTDTNAQNAVAGHRRLGDGGVAPMLWTPADGLIELRAEGVSNVATLNNDGTLFAKLGSELVLWRDGEIEPTGIHDEAGTFGTTNYFPISRDAAGRLVTEWVGGVPGTHDYKLASPDGEIAIAIWHRGRTFAPSVTESGLLLNLGQGDGEGDPAGGWYAIAEHDRFVVSAAGQAAHVWADSSGVTIEATHGMGGLTRFVLDAQGGLDWAPVPSTPLDTSPSRTVVYDHATDAWLVLTPASPRLDVFGTGDNLAWFGNEHRISRAASAFFLPDGRPVFAGLNDDGHVVILWEPFVDARYTRWSDLSARHLEPQGLQTPGFVGELASFVTPWGAMNIVGIDAAGDVHAVWWAPGSVGGRWTSSNLSDLAGAPTLVGDITATATDWGAMQIFGTDDRGHVIALWWSPGSRGWRATDLTARTAGFAVETSSLTVRTLPWSGISIVGKSAEGDVVSYWWTPTDRWVSESITDRLGEEAPVIPGPVSYQTTAAGTQHIAGVDESGHVMHMFWQSDGLGWRVRDLTELALG